MFQKEIKKSFTKISFKNPLLYTLLIIKLLTVISLNYCNEANFSDKWSDNTILALYSGDSKAYITPIENFIKEGEYYYPEKHGKVYAGRAPYYGSIFYVLRQFLDYYTALDFLAFLQILTECFAGITMAVMVLKFTRAPWTFWSTLILFSASFYHSDFSGRILTESFTTSSLIFFLYYFYKLHTDKNRKNYLIAGFWLSIAVVFKPYFAPLFLLFFLMYDKSKNPLQNLVSGILISLNLILMILPFTVRNYVQFNNIQPFSSFDGGTGITKGDFAYRKYIQSIGESIVFWDPHCAGCLFTNIKIPCHYTLPDRVFTTKTDRNVMNEARDLYIDYLNEKTPEKEKLVIEKFDSMREDYRISKPFMYYIGSRMLLLSRFVFQKASYYIPNPFEGNMYYIVATIKAVQFLFYYFITLTGLAGLIYLTSQNFKLAIIPGIVPVYLLLLFPITLRAIEWRFWSNSHYFLIMSTILFIHYIKSKYTSRGKSKSEKPKLSL